MSKTDNEREFIDYSGFRWTDDTSYSQGQERVPKAWLLNLRYRQSIRIRISCGHYHYPGDWIFTCHELGLDTPRLLKAKTKEDAALEAINECIDRAEDFLVAMKHHKPKNP